MLSWNFFTAKKTPWKDVMLHLKSVGNNVSCYEFGGSIVQGIHRKKNDIIEAYCDPRKGGKPDGI